MGGFGVVKFLILGFSFFFVASALLGGLEHVDASDEEAIRAGKLAFQEVASRSNSLNYMQFLELKSAKKQIVAGIMWWLKFEMGMTDCEKEAGQQEAGSDCTVTQVQECVAKLYSVVWENKNELEQFHCSPVSEGKQAQGGATPKRDISREAAQFAAEQINRQSGTAYRTVVTDVISASVKEADSTLEYRLQLELAPTKCKNKPKQPLPAAGSCSPAPGQRRRCSVVVAYSTHFSLKSCGCCGIATDDVMQPEAIAAGGLLLGGAPMLPQAGAGVGAEQSEEQVKEAVYWAGFKNKFGKHYTAQEEPYRFKVFLDNLEKAAAMQRAEQGTARYGITPFSDLTESEFQRRLSRPWDLSVRPERQADIPAGSAPDSVDWRQHGAVTAVKNQGSCGSCWAFSTTGNVEGQWKLKRGKLLSLSEQELVDCDKLDDGCSGGLPSNAYKSIIKLGGLELESDYSYEGEHEKCSFSKSKARVFINSSVAISKDEGDMATWLAKNGPISIGINANAMQWYMGGISHPWRIFCNPDSLDHGVLIVGYGTEDGTPYWIVKNSWGPSWGEDGYYRVYRGAGVCGLNQMATSAVVD